MDARSFGVHLPLDRTDSLMQRSTTREARRATTSGATNKTATTARLLDEDFLYSPKFEGYIDFTDSGEPSCGQLFSIQRRMLDEGANNREPEKPSRTFQPQTTRRFRWQQV